MVVIMTASQFITQLQIMSKNQSPEMKASPMYRQQRILLYILPFVFAVLRLRVPARRDVLLADLEHLDAWCSSSSSSGTCRPRAARRRWPARRASRRSSQDKMTDDADGASPSVDRRAEEARDHPAPAAGGQEPSEEDGSSKK